MMRFTLMISALLVAMAPAAATASAPAGEGARVLLVVSSHGRDDGKTQPGFEMDELAQAWLVFRDNGFATDIASPEGGLTIPDDFNADKPYNLAFTKDAAASAKLAKTLQLSQVDSSRYAAIFIIGGKGAMFDLPFSQSLTTLVASVHGAGGIIGAVCHGPAVFARMRDKDGKPFVAGRTLAGFTDEEEALFGKTWVQQFPFQIESEFRRQGATFSEAPFMLPHVAVDDRIVTGQNPYSVALAAEAVVTALGKAPASRPQWADEKSMLLLAAALTRPDTLAPALAKDHKDLDVPLIAIWGYYRTIEAAGDRARTIEGLRVMEAAEPWFDDKGLDDAIAGVRKTIAAGAGSGRPD
jgi:putative intracellular protease/amidase